MIAVVVSGLIYWALQLWWIVYPQHDPLTVMTIQFSFAQSYSGFVSVFLAGLLGWFAIREFAENRERPDLILLLHRQKAGNGAERLAVNKEQGGIFWEEFYIAVHNEGNVTAVWFFVEVGLACLRAFIESELKRYPQGQELAVSLGDLEKRALQFDEPIAGTMKFKPETGAAENWQVFWDVGNKVLVARFMSLGRVAVYPRIPLVLSRLHVPIQSDPATYQLAYKIATDRTKLKECSVSVELC